MLISKHFVCGLMLITMMAFGLIAAGGCGGDDSGAPAVNTSNGAIIDTGNQGDGGTGLDTGVQQDTASSNGTPDTSDGEDAAGEDAAEDTSDDAEADAPVDAEADAEIDAEVDAPVDACGGCADGEVCVSNETTEGTCFARDCADQQCNADQVCEGGLCIVVSCAGVDCGGYPNICRGGICEVGTCRDPDVFCPEGRECTDEGCLLPCEDQALCDPLACIDGYCRPCEDGTDCGSELICVAEQCVEPCTATPDACDGGEVCDPDSGLCIPPCGADDDCTPEQICDPDTGLCVAEECNEEGAQSTCEGGEICIAGRCELFQTQLAFGLCSGCGQMQSSRYKAIVVLSPVELISDVATSSRYRLESGTISVLRDADGE